MCAIPCIRGCSLRLAGELILFRESQPGHLRGCRVALVHLFICFYEEPTLTRRYGDEYLRFKQNVPRWLPRLKAVEGRGRVGL